MKVVDVHTAWQC